MPENNEMRPGVGRRYQVADREQQRSVCLDSMDIPGYCVVIIKTQVNATC